MTTQREADAAEESVAFRRYLREAFAEGFDAWRATGGKRFSASTVCPEDVVAPQFLPQSAARRAFNESFSAWLPTTPPDSPAFGLDRSQGMRPAPRRSWWLRLRVWIASRVLRVAVE